MLQIRLQGTSNAIKMGIRMVVKSGKVEVIRISSLEHEENSDKYYRVYLDVLKVNKMEDSIRHENSEMCRRFFESKSEQVKGKRASGQSSRTGRRTGNV